MEIRACLNRAVPVQAGFFDEPVWKTDCHHFLSSILCCKQEREVSLSNLSDYCLADITATDGKGEKHANQIA
jgi:hypothetical protein